MRLAVVSVRADADRVAALLERTGVPPLAGVDDLHDELARRHGVEPADLAPPVHVGADLWFRLRQAAREGDLTHADWAVTGTDVLPHVLGTWRYVAPDLRVVVVRPSDGTALPTAAVAYVAAHPDRSVVLDADVLDALDAAALRDVVAGGGGGALDASGTPTVDPAGLELELLRAEAQVLRARLAAVPAEAAAKPAKPARAAKQAKARPQPTTDPATDPATDPTQGPAADPARDDLVDLLDWLGSARSAALVRKDRRFRDLRDRYPDGGS